MKTQARDFLAELEEPVLEVLPEVTIAPSTKLLDTVHQDILELLVKSVSIPDIALRLRLPESTVRAIAVRKDTQDSLRLLTESMDELRILKLKNWYEGVIDDRIADTDNLGETTRKDTLEVVKGYQDLLLQEKKQRKPEAEQNIYVNILQQIME
jgi:hypothetical protein